MLTYRRFSVGRRHHTRLAINAMKATVDGTVIAESDKCVVVEGNQYFPPDSVKKCGILPTCQSPSAHLLHEGAWPCLICLTSCSPAGST